MFDKKYFVYILSSKKKGTLYVGIANDIKRRVVEHKTEWFLVLQKNTKSFYLSILKRLENRGMLSPGKNS